MAFKDWLKEYRESQGSNGTSSEGSSKTASKTSGKSTSGSSGSGNSNSFSDWLSEYREKRATESAEGWAESSINLLNDTQERASKWFDGSTHEALSNKYTSLLAQADNWRKQYTGNDEALSYIDSVVDALSKAKAFTWDRYQTYSKFKSQDEYDNAVQEGKEQHFRSSEETREDRKKRYEDNQKRIEALKAERQRVASTQPSTNLPYSFGDTSMGWFIPATDPTYSERLKAIDAEIAELEADMHQYERGEGGYTSKTVDDYYDVTKQSDFGAVSANRNYTNPSRWDLQDYDIMTDSSQWYSSGVFGNQKWYDQFGNEIDITNTDAKGNVIHPATQDSKYVVTDRLGMFLSATESDLLEAAGTTVGTEGTWASILKDGLDGSWDQLTQNEISIYYYLLGNSGQETADKYLSDMTTELNRRQTMSQNQHISDSWSEASFLEKIALNIATVPANVFGNVTGFIEDTAATIQGEDVNPYSAAHSGMHFSNTVRGEQAQDLDETGIVIPVLDFSLGDIYQVGMSRLDSALATGIGGGMGTILLGMGAAENEAYRLYQSGASAEQITWGALTAGAAEAVFEYASFDKLIKMKDAKTVGQWVKNALIQGGIESSEEGFTDIANTITNAIIMGSESDWDKLVEENDGDTWMAFLSKVQETAQSTFGGFLGGMGAGVTSAGKTYVQTQKRFDSTGNTIVGADGGVDALRQLANEMAGVPGADQKSLTKQISKVDKKATAKRVGRLYDTVVTAGNTQNQADIAKSLERKGISHKSAESIAEALVAEARGQKLTDEQKRLLKSAKADSRVQSAIANIVENRQSTMGQRNKKIGGFEFGIAVDMLMKNMSKAQEQQGKNIASSEGSVTTVAENASQVHHEVSEDGKMINTKTGDVIDPQGLVQAEDGTYMIAAKGANPVSSGEVSYADSNQALVYETFVNLEAHSGKTSRVIADMDLASRNELMGLYNPQINKDGGRFVNGILDAFFYGHRGTDLSAVSKGSPVWELTEQQRKIAWNTGRVAGLKANEKSQSHVDAVYAEAKKILESGKAKKGSYHAVLDDGISPMSLNGKQKAVYRYADEIAQGIQTNIRVYAGKNKAQGFYNHETDEIWLNLNAANTGREAIMAFTLAHEIVHRSKKGSPAQYQAFVDFLMKEYGKQGSDVEAMIAEQIQAAKDFNKTVPAAKKVNMTREKALEEVVCDACQRMLLDTDAGQKLAEFGAQSRENKSFLEDLKRWITELLDKLRRYFRNAETDSLAAKEFNKFDANVKKILADMYVDMSIDAGEKLSTIKAAYGGEFAQKFQGLRDIQYNLAAVDSHKTKLQKEYSEDSSTDLKTIMARYDKIIDIWTKLGGELNSKFLAEWNSKVGKDRTFTIFKAQAGYKYNVELSSMCKKGVPLFEAIDTIVKQEVMKELGTDILGKAEKEILYDILKQHNFEIPCAICYVEQARQREGVIIDAFLNGKVDKNAKGEVTKVKLGWNEVLDSIQKEMKANGVDYRFAQVSRDIATEKYTPVNLTMDMKTQAAFYAALKKIANKEIARYNKAEGKSRKLLTEVTPEAVKECFKGTLPANLKIFKVLFEEPSSRFKIQNDLLYSSVATQNLSMAHNKLYGLFNSQGGVSGYKTKQGTTIYWGDILGKSWKPDTLRNEGGVRNQSNSDFQMYTLLDQAQMYLDFTAKGYYLQAYTKVLSELKLFGLSRGKINASLIPKVVVYRNADGSVDIERTMATAGLDENGDPIYDDIEGINHNEAFMLIEDPEYSKSICGICIGYSDAHINKLLDDPRVQQIIGFHDKTDDGSKRYKGARYAKNYNGLNEAVNKEGKTVHIGFNPYVKRAEKKFRFNAETETFEGTVNYNGKTYTADDIPRLATDLYLEMCAKKEYTPAYNDFKGHRNYYKLLADFGLYDSQGHYAPHRKVVYNMPDTVPYLDANGKKQTMKTYDYIKIELEKELTVRDSIAEALADTSSEGIIPQFKAEVKKRQAEKSFSLPKGDQAYMDAVNQGDMETAQKMVDEAAKAAGYTTKGYHGTHSYGFTSVDSSLWLARDRSVAKTFAPFNGAREHREGVPYDADAVYPFYYRLGHNLLIDADGFDWGALPVTEEEYPGVYVDEETGDITTNAMAEWANGNGYDSITFANVDDGGFTTVDVVFDPKRDAKSSNPVTYDDSGNVIPLSERFNAKNDDIRYSLPKSEPAPTFYSHMAKVVDGVKQEKLGAASVVSMLRGKGVKAEEIKWSGLETFLEGKKSVTKAELQEFIAGSMLQIEEEILDNKDRPYTEDQQKRLDEYEAKRDEVAKRLADEWKKITGEEFPIQNAGAGLESSVVNKIIDANLEHKDASFEGRLLAKLRKDLQKVIDSNDDFGFDSWKDALRSIHRHRKDFIKSYDMSTNDKAVIVKYCNALNAYNELPNRISDADTDRLRAIARETDPWNRKIMEVKHEHNEEEAKYMTNWGQYRLEGGRNYREMLFRIPGSTYSNEAMFTHWKERKGVLAHARVQDMDTFIGKMLFIEEIQSDWHNAGHKDGYRDPGTEDKYTLAKKMEAYTEEFFASPTADMVKERIAPIGYEGAGVSMILNFLIDSQESMQSTLNTLNRKGASFTESEVDEIAKYAREYEEMYHKWEKAPGDLTAPDAPFKDTYHEYVMKRLIRMAVEQDYDSIGWTTAVTQDERWANNLPHKEGEGKSGFLKGYTIEYDQDIPKFLNKYGKKWDTKVGKTVLDNGTEVWSMAITDEMKDSVLYEGQVMYSLPKSNNPYSYEALISKPDMVVTTVDSIVPKDRAELVRMAKQNAATVGKTDPKSGSVSVYVKDIGRNVGVGRDGLKHSLDGGRISVNAPILVKVGEILSNSIRINELTPREDKIDESYVLIGAARNADNDIYVVRFVVNRFTHKLISVDALYAVNAKKEPAALLPLSAGEPALGTDSTISIAELLGYVNQYFPDILPEEVLKHYGHDSRPKGKLGEDALYKLPIGEDTSPRALLANAFEGIITNDIEKRKIQEYKGNVEKLNAEEKKLHELRAQIKELSFAKGKRDTKKIKELQFDAVHTANRIATLDKMLLRMEAATPLQNILKREKEMAYKRAEQKGKEALKAYREAERERDRQWQSQVKDKYQASKKKAIETREKREAREKLQKLVLDTAKWISYPAKTDVKCPDILKQPYADFLKSIDMSSQRLANGGDPTQNDLRLTNAMGSLATALERVMVSQDPSQDATAVLDTGYLDLPANFVQKLRDMTEDVKAMMVDGDYVVNNMSAAEVRQLSQMIRTLNHAIKEVSTLYANLRFANVEALGDNTMSFMDDLGEIEKTGGMKDFVQWDNALPYYAFKRFGVGGESIFDGLMDAQDKLAFLAQKIFDFQKKAWTGKEAKAWSEDTHTIDLPNGNTLTLTTADAMSIYCLSRRQQGLQHLLGGGTRVIGLQKGSQKAKDSRSILSVKDIDAIISSLTDRQKQVADAIQEFMSTVCSDWGNEISMKRFLTKEFNEKFYFPIESNDENLATKDPSAQQSDLFRLLNISATKPIDPRANNEVIIRNIFDVFTNHASDMARLNAYGMPLLDYMKWLNYREKTVNEEGQIKVRGVRKSMESAYGAAAKSYVLNLVKDVNGRPSDGGDPNILMKWMRSAKTASVGSSLRVATLQITSYPRAALVLSPKSLTLGLSKLPQIEKAKKYCGIALWKSFGFYDTNISRSIEDQMKGVTDVKQKLIELSLKGAELGDAITWGCLWNACEYEVAATKKYKVGTEEFYQAVGMKLREVIYRTQVVDSTLTRSQIMRSKRGMAQEAAAFMSEPTLSANILMDAGFQFNAEKRRTGSTKVAWKNTGKYITKAIAVYAIGQLAAALLESFWDAWRDDDDEEFGEKYWNAFVQNLVLDLLPLNKLPILSDAVDLVLSTANVGYFSSDKMSTMWMSQAKSAVDAWKDVLGGESSITVYNAIYKTMRAISSLTGVSFSGVMREGVALWNITAGAYDITWKIRTWDLSKTDLAGEALDAIIEGNDRQASSIRAEFPDEDSYRSAIRSAIRERYTAGEISYDTAIKYLVKYGGLEEDDAYWRAEEWKYESDTGDDFSKYDEFFTAVQTGKNLKAVIKKYTDNGVAVETLAKQITDHFKPLYIEMSKAEKAGIKGYLLNAFEQCGVKREDATKKLQYWEFLSEQPDTDLTQYQIADYYEFAKPAGISADLYSEYCSKVKGIEGDDKKKRRMAVIHSMPLTKAQKDALYFAEGWAKSTLNGAPWH